MTTTSQNSLILVITAGKHVLWCVCYEPAMIFRVYIALLMHSFTNNPYLSHMKPTVKYICKNFKYFQNKSCFCFIQFFKIFQKS